MKSKHFNYWIIGLLLLLVPQQTIQANGDPVIRFSSINRAGNPTPRPIKDIQILKEHLLIQPRGEYTYVEVEYILHNHSNKNYKRIDYGFPIDYQGESESTYFIPDYITESIYETGWKKEWIKDIQFSLNGKSLKWHAAHEVVTPKHREYVVEYEDTATIESASRLWHYTQFSIKKQDTVSLKVSYQVYQQQHTPLSMLRKSPLSRHFTGGGFFFYDFSPAQHWGDGTAHQMEIIVDCSVIQNTDITWERDYRLEEKIFTYPFKLRGNRWICQTEKFNFKDAELFFYFGWGKRWGTPLSTLHAYEVDKSLYQIKTSSSENEHPAHHLNDKDIETAWAPLSNDKERTIVVSFPKPQVVSDIMLYNGNQASVLDWIETPRIGKLLMEITWADGYQETKELDLNETYSDNYRYYKDEYTYNHPCFITLYNLIDKIYGRYKDDTWHPIVENRISQIKLTIREPLPADSSEKICVSEIILLNGWK